MRLLFALSVLVFLAAAAVPEKKPTKPKPVTTTTKPKVVEKPKPQKGNATEPKGNSTEFKGNATEEVKEFHKGNFTEGNFTEKGNHTEKFDFEEFVTIFDYCYDSSWSFTCRQLNPSEYELECRIANADGLPCFPDLVKMIEVAAPLSTITYPVYSFEAHENAKDIDDTPIMVTADNIEAISLHAPFHHVPADAFALLPHLKRITLEALDGVEWIDIDKHAFRNTTAKHLHLTGHNVRFLMSQKIDLHYFDTITFSDVQIECYHDEVKKGKTVENFTCDHLFEGMKSIETMSLESIYVKHDKLDEHVFNPMKDTLKKLTVDVVYTRDEAEKNQWYKHENKTNATLPALHHGHFPVETFAFMTRLEELELYLYNPIVGLSIQNDTAIPLPVAKTLTRLVLSCRYCKEVSLKELGKMLPNLHHLTIAAPLESVTLTDVCLKSFSKLKELVIFDSNLKAIKPGAFKSTPALKHLTIKYAPMEEALEEKHWDGIEDTLEHLAIVGTPMKHINVSKLTHLVSLDVSQNHLTAIERSMLPEKAKFSEFNLCHNPIKHIEHGFLTGLEMKSLRLTGWDIESMDLNVLEGIVNLHTVDLTQHLKMKTLHVTDHKKLPSTLERIVVGRSPFLWLDNGNGSLAEMLIERNMTMVIEGKVACCCAMKWMTDMKMEHPNLLEIHRSRAMCSREGTEVELTMPETFWKNPTLANFLVTMEDEKICKKKAKRSAEVRYRYGKTVRPRILPIVNETEFIETMKNTTTMDNMKNSTMEEKPHPSLVNTTEHENETVFGLNSTMEAAEIMKLNASLEENKTHSPRPKRSPMVSMTEEGNETSHLNSTMEAAEILKLNASFEETKPHSTPKRSVMENMTEEANMTIHNMTMEDPKKPNKTLEEEKPLTKRSVMAEKDLMFNSTMEETKFNSTMDMKMFNSTIEAAEIKKLNGTIEENMAEKNVTATKPCKGSGPCKDQ